MSQSKMNLNSNQSINSITSVFYSNDWTGRISLNLFDSDIIGCSKIKLNSLKIVLGNNNEYNYSDFSFDVNYNIVLRHSIRTCSNFNIHKQELV